MTSKIERKKNLRQADINEAKLAQYMQDALKVPGRTKRTAARLAINSAIREIYSPGDVLPPEKDLALILGVGLGTVQVALRQLQEIGAITRRRGDGTRVSSGRSFNEDLWHFRFEDVRTGSAIHLTDEWVKLDLVPQNPVLEERLGKHVAYQRIRRVYTAPGRAPVAAEMFLNPALKLDLSTTSVDGLQKLNIRKYLEDEFDIHASGWEQTVTLAKLSDKVASEFGLSPGMQVQVVNALTTMVDETPIYFQRFYVPADEYTLNFSSRAG